MFAYRPHSMIASDTKAHMDALLFLKPILTTLVLPAASGLLLLFAGLLWAWRRSTGRFWGGPRLPLALMGLTASLLWLLSCQAVAIWLSLHLLPQVSPITPSDLKQQQVQALVVLGGGVDHEMPEYGGPTLTPDAMSRLLYGIYLSRSAQLPMAYSGGIGWAGAAHLPAEAEVAARSLARLGAAPLRWQESQSRDTRENAVFTSALLKAEGITRIALITHAWHMPRSVRQFEAAGLQVTPAPMGYIRSDENLLLQWLPSGTALRDSGRVLKEWLGLLLT